MDRVVRRKQLLELIGVSSSTQWRMERAGEFPARVKIGRGLVGWHLTEVEKWLANRERVLGLAQECEMSRRASDRVMGGQLGIDSKLPFIMGKRSAIGSEEQDE